MDVEKINIGGNEYYVSENPEWIRVITDNEGKIIAGIRNNGVTYIAELEGIDIDSIKQEIQEYLEEITSNIKDLNNTFEYIDDIEQRIEITTDSSSKIISHRKSDGTLVENVGIETKNLKIDEYDIASAAKMMNISEETVIFNNKSTEEVLDYIEKDESNDTVYVGYIAPFEEKSVIIKFDICLYGASNLDLNTKYDFVIGKVDHRWWLLPRLTVSKNVTSVNDGKLCFDFSDDKLICNKGEVIFICAHQTVACKNEGSNKIVSLNNNPSRTKVLAYTKDILNSVSYVESDIINYPDALIYISSVSVNSIFTTVNETDILGNKVTSLTKSDSLKQNAVIEDRVTGEKYRIYINNGQIVLRSNRYSRMLCIGNSFTNHTYYPNTWPETSNNRSMAASTDACMYASHLENVIGCTVDRTFWAGQPGLTIERTLMDSDFTVPNNDKQYDAVILQLGENIISHDTVEVKETFKTMYKALKSTWPSADIFGMFGNMWGNISDNVCQCILDAALEENIPFIDCSYISMEGRYQPNDYVTDINGGVFELTHSGVYGGHPSDVGMYNMANLILKTIGYNEIVDRKFNITKVQTTGGSISTPCDYWISEGLVTVRCIPQNGYEIDSLTVKTTSGEYIQATKRISRYTSYTFIMPSSSIIITPYWKEK